MSSVCPSVCLSTTKCIVANDTPYCNSVWSLNEWIIHCEYEIPTGRRFYNFQPRTPAFPLNLPVPKIQKLYTVFWSPNHFVYCYDHREYCWSLINTQNDRLSQQQLGFLLMTPVRPCGIANTHDTCSRNRCHRPSKSTPYSGAGFRRRFFVPYASGRKNSGAENKHGWKQRRRWIRNL